MAGDAKKHSKGDNMQDTRQIQSAQISSFKRDFGIDEFELSEGLAKKKVLSFADNIGIMQLNNVNSGNLITSLTTKENKRAITKIHYINRGAVWLLAGCLDGTLFFVSKPVNMIAEGKEFKPNGSADQQRTIFKNGVHSGEITCIASNHIYAAVGGSDGYVSVWRLVGMLLTTKIEIPNAKILVGPQIACWHVSDLHFVYVSQDSN